MRPQPALDRHRSINAKEAYRIHLAAKEVLDPAEPIRPVKGVRLKSWDRTSAAHRIIRMARRHGDKALEVDALGAFLDALSPEPRPSPPADNVIELRRTGA